MKLAAKILAMLAIMILCSNAVEAADSEKVFVARKHLVPPRMRRPFLPAPKFPQKEYYPRQTFRPKPHYLPQVPKPSYDNRGGKRKKFGPPQAPHR